MSLSYTFFAVYPSLRCCSAGKFGAMFQLEELHKRSAKRPEQFHHVFKTFPPVPSLFVIGPVFEGNECSIWIGYGQVRKHIFQVTGTGLLYCRKIIMHSASGCCDMSRRRPSIHRHLSLQYGRVSTAELINSTTAASRLVSQPLGWSSNCNNHHNLDMFKILWLVSNCSDVTAI